MKPKHCHILIILLLLFMSATHLSADEALSLPPSVDNSKTPWFPDIFDQSGESCASAGGVSYVFTYELNAARGTSADSPENMYPYFYTYNFLNGGDQLFGTPFMYSDAWEIIRNNGIMNLQEFGTPDYLLTKWPSGYEHYLSGMENRITTYDSLSFFSPEAISFFRHWLFDHGNGSETGGLFLIIVCAMGIQDELIPQGPEMGKYIIRSLGTQTLQGQHVLTVVGYNDDIVLDANDDGLYTDSIDINNDGKIDLLDREHGAFKCANTWGTGSWDDGFVYIPYRLFLTTLSKGGLLTDKGYYLTVSKDYKPSRTFKTTITHDRRNAIAVSVGIASDSAAATPEKIRQVKQFTYAGGELPMGGMNFQNFIEIGIDVSDLADSIGPSNSAAYYLVIKAREAGGWCNELSLIDYTGDEEQSYTASSVPVEFPEGTTVLRIPAPAVAVKKRLHIPSRRSTLQLIHRNGTVICIPPSGVRRISLFRSDGRLLRTREITDDRPVEFPHLQAGMYIVDAVFPPGRHHSKRFVFSR